MILGKGHKTKLILYPGMIKMYQDLINSFS